MSTGEILDLPLASLHKGPVVRGEQVNAEHVEALRAVVDEVPPIIVRLLADESFEVIDGRHRWEAASAEGREVIRSVVADLGPDEAFEQAVKANVRHGLPLSLTERTTAARTMVADTDWSDRRIASACGLSNTAVSGLRDAVTSTVQLTPGRRTGSDGKGYPTSEEAKAQREALAEFFRANPAASLGAAATETGASKMTAAKVRAEILAENASVATDAAGADEAEEPGTDAATSTGDPLAAPAQPAADEPPSSAGAAPDADARPASGARTAAPTVDKAPEDVVRERISDWVPVLRAFVAEAVEDVAACTHPQDHANHAALYEEVARHAVALHDALTPRHLRSLP